MNIAPEATESDPQIAEEELDSALRIFASNIVKRRLEVPAKLFLEMHKPLCGILYNMSVFSAPLIHSFFGAGFEKAVTGLFERPENIERLIDLIEEAEKSRMEA